MKIKMKIGTRLIVSMTTLVIAAIAAICVFTGMKVIRSNEQSAATLAHETAHHYANVVKAELEVALDEARALSVVFESAANVDGFQLTRRKANMILKYFIEGRTDFLGTYVLFEPDAFDGKDINFIGELGHDETGRFIPYWTRGEDGTGVLEPLLNYSVEGEGDYYQIPKKRNQESVLDPYIYPIQGKDVLLTSLVVPVRSENKEFIGIAGIDLTLDSLQRLVSEIEIEGFPNAYVTFYSAGGIVVASKNTDSIGDFVGNATDVQEIIDGVAGNQDFNVKRVSQLLGEEVLTEGVAVEIGNTGTKWMVTVNIPTKTLAAQGMSIVRFIIIIGLTAAFVAILITYFLSRGISKPLKRAVSVTGAIAQGDLSIDIHNTSTDETGQLLDAMQRMKEKLREVINTVKGVSDSVLNGSQEISSTAQQVSQGSTEQAAVGEEVSSSIEEMSANIRQNADNAKETEKIAQKAAEDAQISGKSVSEAVEAMKQIANRISIIEEIARSTNMLSLNASIEAARAGEQGKGFAVVAAEVGKLAARSKQAAEEIGKLSSSTVVTAEEAGEMLKRLVPDIQRTAELVQEISAASAEQNSGAEQINKAVVQLDTVIQQNASAAEELASMAEKLSGQAQEVTDAVGYFSDSNVKIAASVKKEDMPLKEQQNINDGNNGHSEKIEKPVLVAVGKEIEEIKDDFDEF